MLTLYTAAGACSLAPHIVLEATGLDYRAVHVDLRAKQTEDGGDYLAINPKGAVPALVLGDGSLLTETAAVLQEVADRVPDKGLAPAWGSAERYRLVEWINFVASELHAKHLQPMFGLAVPDLVKNRARAGVAQPLAFVAKVLEGREVLLGDHFTVADAYLFWALLVAPHGGASLDAWPSLTAYVARHLVRASVQTALAVERPLYLAHAQAAA